MAYFRLKAGAHTAGTGNEVAYYLPGDIVEANEPLAAREPAKWEAYEGTAPKKGKREEDEPPPPPPAGDAERAEAALFAAESQGTGPTHGKGKAAAPAPPPRK